MATKCWAAENSWVGTILTDLPLLLLVWKLGGWDSYYNILYHFYSGFGSWKLNVGGWDSYLLSPLRYVYKYAFVESPVKIAGTAVPPCSTMW